MGYEPKVRCAGAALDLRISKEALCHRQCCGPDPRRRNQVRAHVGAICRITSECARVVIGLLWTWSHVRANVSWQIPTPLTAARESVQIRLAGPVGLEPKNEILSPSSAEGMVPLGSHPFGPRISNNHLRTGATTSRKAVL